MGYSDGWDTQMGWIRDKLRQLCIRQLCAQRTLTDEQKEAFDVLYWPLSAQPGAKVSLVGPAGTGKTYLAARLAERLGAEGLRVRLCAPTHQAAEVLRSKLGSKLELPENRTSTIQSLLGLKLGPDGRGDYHLVLDGTAAAEPGDVVICDEASMVGQDLWRHIERTYGVSWLFLGDACQLPPVGERRSKALRLRGAGLREIIRQKQGHPIVELGRRIRCGEPPFTEATVQYEGGVGVACTGSRAALFDSAERAFRRAFAQAETPGAARVLAWRNRTVQTYNRLLRDRLYGKHAPPYLAGEWLTCHRTYYRSEVPVLKNSQLLRVTAARQQRHARGIGGRWLTWVLTVETVGVGRDGKKRKVCVLDPSEEAAFVRELARRKEEALKEEALGAEAGSCDRPARWERSRWKRYYAMREQYASVRYAYAQTVHRAQGSTLENAFVDWRDLEGARGGLRQALQYVAATRAEKRLAVLI